MAMQMVKPGRIVDPGGDLDEQFQVLGTRIKFLLGTPEIEAAVLPLPNICGYAAGLVFCPGEAQSRSGAAKRRRSPHQRAESVLLDRISPWRGDSDRAGKSLDRKVCRVAGRHEHPDRT